MKSHRVDDQIREYYGRQRLSEEARSRIKSALQETTPTSPASRPRWLVSGIAAGVLLAIITAAVWLTLQTRSESPEQLAATIAQYAAAHHSQHQELEFQGTRASDLRREMKSLDFTPVEPALMERMEMRLVGARYTTIGGVIAAQILYLDPKGEACTLFQARPVDELAIVPESEHVVDGVRVNVWREKGLLMVLARPA